MPLNEMNILLHMYNLSDRCSVSDTQAHTQNIRTHKNTRIYTHRIISCVVVVVIVVVAVCCSTAITTPTFHGLKLMPMNKNRS